jgi:hypothetical protein
LKICPMSFSVLSRRGEKSMTTHIDREDVPDRRPADEAFWNVGGPVLR